MEKLNFNQLFYFYVVATEGSIKAACEKLHLTQPTISGQIKILEEDLGFQLFIRKHRKLEISPHGRAILKKAEKIFLMGEELLNSLPGVDNKLRTEIKIGIVPTISHRFLHEFTTKAWQDPNMYLQIIHGDHNFLIEQMNQDLVDLVLSDSPPLKSSKRYKTINLHQEPLAVVGTEKFKEVKKNFPYSLSQIPFLSFGWNGQVYSEIEYFLKINNIQPDYIGNTDDPLLIRMASLMGYCVAILPQSVVDEDLQEKRLIKMGNFPQVTLNNWLITSQLGSRKILIRKLINNYLHNKNQLTQ